MKTDTTAFGWTCADSERLVARWASGADCSAGETAACAAHASSCAMCARTFGPIIFLLARDAGGTVITGAEEPSDGFTDGVMAAVRRQGAARGPKRGLTLPALAAAAVLLLAVGVGIYAWRGNRASTVTVRFELSAPGADSVALVGTFTGWADAALPMRDRDGDGLWEVTVRLRPRAVYTYNFVINGDHWIADPAGVQVDDGFGGASSMLSL